MSTVDEVYQAQLAKTIARILDELDRAKEGYMALNPEKFSAFELTLVQSSLNGSILPTIIGIADSIEGIVAASDAAFPEPENQ